ncbi:hypothetical protein KP509_35G057000 [Ceratopteris richardii]|uniref:Uncharacterized protein n=1 Tax=Ceratopteris richardii TaxID=49495 RepID=A0A8T2QHI0_CERRI|nr:hypothetical protein KP509_35G057000 [Ceratopteris richardii]
MIFHAVPCLQSTASSSQSSTTLAALIGIARDGSLTTVAPALPIISRALPGDVFIPIRGLVENAKCAHQGAVFVQAAPFRNAAIKLSNFWPCTTCKEFRYSNRDLCGALCCQRKGDIDILPPTTPLGRLLVAERRAERSVNRVVDAGSRNVATSVYLNIIYEETSGIEQTAMNPLFDLDSTSPWK